MELQIVGAKKPLSVSEAVFGREFSEGLVHQVVVAYRNAGRAGTKAQKSRAEVRGTTKKFKAQKGGGARHGDYRAPIFVGGGRTFAAKPRDFSQNVDKINTKALLGKLKDYTGRTLIVTESVEENLYLSARNLSHIAVVDVAAIDPVSLVDADNVLLTVDSVKKIEE